MWRGAWGGAHASRWGAGSADGSSKSAPPDFASTPVDATRQGRRRMVCPPPTTVGLPAERESDLAPCGDYISHLLGRGVAASASTEIHSGAGALAGHHLQGAPPSEPPAPSALTFRGWPRQPSSTPARVIDSKRRGGEPHRALRSAWSSSPLIAERLARLTRHPSPPSPSLKIPAEVSPRSLLLTQHRPGAVLINLQEPLYKSGRNCL